MKESEIVLISTVRSPNYFIFNYVCVNIHVPLCVTNVSACRGQKRAWNPGARITGRCEPPAFTNLMLSREGLEREGQNHHTQAATTIMD